MRGLYEINMESTLRSHKDRAAFSMTVTWEGKHNGLATSDIGRTGEGVGSGTVSGDLEGDKGGCVSNEKSDDWAPLTIYENQLYNLRIGTNSQKDSL